MGVNDKSDPGLAFGANALDIADVDKYKKGLSATDKVRWLKAANEYMGSCLVGGGGRIECEIAAIREANSLFSKNKKACETRYLNEDNPIDGDNKRVVTKLRLSLQEAENTDDFQMALPIGVFYSSWYGEIIITPSFCQAMVDNWSSKVLGNRQPFIDTLHDRGKANGWILDMQVRGDGLYVKIDWTKMGLENIQEGYFKYFSADIGEVTDIQSGDRVWPVLIAVALCNTPVMNNMPEARVLSDDLQASISGTSANAYNSTHGDGVKSSKKESIMNEHDLLAAFKELDSKGQSKFLLMLVLNERNQSTQQATDFKTQTNDANTRTPVENKQLNEQSESGGGDEVPEDDQPSIPSETGQSGVVVNQTDNGCFSEVVINFNKAIEAMQKAALQFSAPETLKKPPGDKPPKNEKLEAKVEALEKANSRLTEYIDDLVLRDKEKRKKDVITESLKCGKIIPKDRQFWEQKFESDPDGITEILKKMPQRDIFREVGTGDGGGEPLVFSNEERTFMRKFGLTDEDMIKYGGSVKFPKTSYTYY